LFCEETLNVLVDCFVKILTRKHEKDLQLIWSLKHDTIFRN